MRSGSALFTAVLLIGSLTLLGLSVELGPGVWMVPVSVAAPLCALLGFELGREIRSCRGARSPGVRSDAMPLAVAEPVPELAGPVPPTAPAAAEIAAVAWAVALGALALSIGILAGSAVFVSLFLRRRGGESWAAAAAAGVVTALVLWVVVALLLAVPVPTGMVGSALGRVIAR